MQKAGPVFFRSRFLLALDSSSRSIFRVITKGLGHGSVWVNAHNPGRYPEKIDNNGMYIPECWMKSGENSLIIYDEDGKNSTNVSIESEIAASRELRRVNY